MTDFAGHRPYIRGHIAVGRMSVKTEVEDGSPRYVITREVAARDPETIRLDWMDAEDLRDALDRILLEGHE